MASDGALIATDAETGGVRAGMRRDPHGRESLVYELTPAACAAAGNKP